MILTEKEASEMHEKQQQQQSRGSQEFPHILSLNSLYAFPPPDSLKISSDIQPDSFHSP